MNLLIEYPGLDYGVPRFLSIYPDHVELRDYSGGGQRVSAVWYGNIDRVSLRTVAGLTFLSIRDRDGGVLTMPTRGRSDGIAAKNMIEMLCSEEARDRGLTLEGVDQPQAASPA